MPFIKKFFWKAYLVIILTFALVSLSSMFLLPNPSWLEYAVHILILAFPTLGLAGFVMRKPMYCQYFWKVVFFFSVPYLLWIQFFRFLISDRWCDSNTCALLSLSFGIVFYAPMLMGLFQYAFRSPKIWEMK